jgi:hypothetical protein
MPVLVPLLQGIVLAESGINASAMAQFLLESSVNPQPELSAQANGGDENPSTWPGHARDKDCK